MISTGPVAIILVWKLLLDTNFSFKLFEIDFFCYANSVMYWGKFCLSVFTDDNS